jgi:hypothetical protein
MEFSAINVTQILTTLITTMGAVVCALVGKKVENSRIRDTELPPKSSMSMWAWGMWACIAIAVVNTGILGWRLLRPSPATEVIITYPTNLSRVEQTETVRGTVVGLPEEQVVWVIVFMQEVGRYYPQNRPADLEASNRWSSLVYIGVPSDTDKRFDILVVVADTNAQNALNAYLADARDRGDWAGMEALPEGAVIYDRITVTRK